MKRLVIFDLDGTLTRPALDFDAIRAEIGIASGSILEAVAAMPPADRSRAEAILARHEAEAAANSELQPGASEIVAAIRAAGFAVALMTRNSRPSVRTFLSRHGLAFDLIRTREDGVFKPSPQPVLDICRTLDAAVRDTWVVGDFHYDIVCGRAAGARTALLWDDHRPCPEWAAEADVVITRLMQLSEHLNLPVSTNET